MFTSLSPFASLWCSLQTKALISNQISVYGDAPSSVHRAVGHSLLASWLKKGLYIDIAAIHIKCI